MMLKLLPVVLVIGLSIHGLIHLMGFVAYWPLKDVPELAYKTAFLGGRLEFGANGTRLFSLLWLLAAIGFIVAGIALVSEWSWGVPLLVLVTLLSLVITALDWQSAFRGTLINGAILAVLLLAPHFARLLPQTN